MDTEFDDEAYHGIHQRNASQGAQVLQIDTGKHVAAIAICAVVCGVSVVLAAWAAVVARDATTEYRVLLNHTMEMEAKQDVLISQVEELRHADR